MSIAAPSLSRAALLRGRLRPAPAKPRPPWGLPESAFIQHCDGCGDCLPVCEPGILVRDGAGYAVADFARGACTFCGACADACPTGALVRADDASPWTLRASVTAACLSARGTACRACEDACDESAIRFRPLTRGRALPTIRAEGCTGCGACVAPCPVAAIQVAPMIEGAA